MATDVECSAFFLKLEEFKIPTEWVSRCLGCGLEKKELHVAAPCADIRVAGEGRGIERRRIKGGRSERRAEGSHIRLTSQLYNRHPPKPPGKL